MTKKRSCRRTEQENVYHEKAVRIRKMTDEQLCTYIKNMSDAAYDMGYQKGREELENKGESKQAKNGIVEFLDLITNGNIKGIGIVTINKLIKVASEYGYIQ